MNVVESTAARSADTMIPLRIAGVALPTGCTPVGVAEVLEVAVQAIRAVEATATPTVDVDVVTAAAIDRIVSAAAATTLLGFHTSAPDELMSAGIPTGLPVDDLLLIRRGNGATRPGAAFRH